MHLNSQWDNNIIKPVGLGHYVSCKKLQECHAGASYPSDFIAGFFWFFYSWTYFLSVWNDCHHLLCVDCTCFKDGFLHSPSITKQEASLALL